MSIRLRLLLVNIGVLGLVCIGILVFVGGQITNGLRLDFETRLLREIELIAPGIREVTIAFAQDKIDDTELQLAFAPYAQQTGGELNLYFTGFEQYRGKNTARWQLPAKEPDEIDSALSGKKSVVERTDANGIPRFYTASSVFSLNGEPLAFVQLSVPITRLNDIIAQRWFSLGLIIGGLTLFEAILVGLLSYGMTRSLKQLEKSATRLASGDLKHRFASPPRDEIGAVAHAFNQMADRIQTMLERQQTFASNTSHELRTPLTAIQLRIEALRRSTSLQDPLSRQYLDEIGGEITRLTNMVQGLTLLARLDSDRAELGRDEVDIVRFASALRQQLLPHAEEQGVQLLLTTPDHSVDIQVTLAHLNVAFRNILENALKYTPSGGSICWTLQHAENGILHTITDTGIGISAENLPHIFERFYRADRARSRQIPGSGLGLSLVWTILQVYGGWIRVDSAGSDQGTTVTVYWPLKAPTHLHSPRNDASVTV